MGEVGIGVTEEDPCQDLNQRAAAMPCGLGVERELSLSAMLELWTMGEGE